MRSGTDPFFGEFAEGKPLLDYEFYAVRRPLFRYDEVTDFAERGTAI